MKTTIEYYSICLYDCKDKETLQVVRSAIEAIEGKIGYVYHDEGRDFCYLDIVMGHNLLTTTICLTVEKTGEIIARYRGGRFLLMRNDAEVTII